MDSTGLLRIFKYLSQNTWLLNDFFVKIFMKYFTTKDTILLHAVDISCQLYCHLRLFIMLMRMSNKYSKRCFKDHISISNV